MTTPSSSSTNKNKRKRSSSSAVLPTKLLSSLESSDRKAAKLYRSQTSKDSIPKSLAAQSQLNIQSQLMECRILMQKALSAATDQQEEDIDENDDDNEKSTTTASSVEKGDMKKAADRLLIQLLEVRKKLCPQEIKLKDDSDTDESSDEDEDNVNYYANLVKDKNSDGDENNLDERLAHEYKELKHTWKSTLNRRHTSIRLNSGDAVTAKSSSNKFQVVDQSFWSQVDSTVRHDMLLSASNHDSQTPVFDDSKVYRHMLQDFISLSTERHQSGANSAAEAAAERLKRVSDKKNRSSKNKADVDRKASKGRKIRYVVHEKLTNFTFPISRQQTAVGSSIDENVLFKSMFGAVTRRK